MIRPVALFPSLTRSFFLAAPLLVAALLIPPLLFTTPVRAAEIEGVEFANSIEVGERKLAVWNVGLLRWKFFFKGYVAALYLAQGETPATVFDDKAKRLELHYFYSIAGDKFGAAADELLARWMKPAELERLRSRLDTLHAWYRDVSPGDRYSLTYIPGKGTELALNGEALGTVEGADFAKAYFSIWLGDVPLDGPLRDQLMAAKDAS